MIEQAISFIEEHLFEKLNIDKVSKAVNYSKYYIHHMFTDTLGITMYDYIKRRQITEAAKYLMESTFSITDCHIEYLAVHPQYRRSDAVSMRGIMIASGATLIILGVKNMGSSNK